MQRNLHADDSSNRSAIWPAGRHCAVPPLSLATKLDRECDPWSISDPQEVLPLAKVALN